MPNVKTVVHVNGWPKSPEDLEGFDCIVMYCDGGGRHMANPNLDQVNRYVKQGVGVVCIHYAVETTKGKNGEAFLDWIGGYFEPHWSVNPHWVANFNKFPKHPIANGVKPFSTDDEWYYHMRFRKGMPGVTPILTDLPPASTLVKPDGSLARPENAHNNNPHARAAVLERKEPQHVAWALQRKDGGRGFGFTGGHNHWNWGNPNQLRLMLNAIVWCAKAEVPKDGVPVSEVTLDQLKENQDYEPRAGIDFSRIQKDLDSWNGRKTLGLVPAAAPSITKKDDPQPKSSKALFTSSVVTSKTKGHAVDINVDLKGAKKLYLVVSDGGNGYGCDWADWINPRLTGPDGEKSLTELKWVSAKAGYGSVQVNRNCVGREARVNGKLVPKCIGTHADSVIEYDVPKGFTHFKAQGGLDNGGTNQGCGSTVRFEVFSTKPTIAAGLEPIAQAGSRDRKDALAQLDVAEGLQATMFAAEPIMSNPVNIDIDHKGRVWVVEVVNYRRFRNNDSPLREDGDRVLIVEDTNGDGEADKTRTFYQHPDLNKGHGICVLPGLDGSWRVIVSCSDQIFTLFDDDGDLKADRRELLFHGGGPDHDHGLHSFSFGPDGKLYFNFGNTGTKLVDKNGKPVVDLAGNTVNNSRQPYQEGMVFRCDLDGSNVETLGWNFRNNWEVSVDSFGTLWQSDNDDDGNRGVRINYVMEFGNYGYKDEMTGAGWKTPRTNLEKEIPLRHWHLNDPGVVPNLLQTGAGSPTGICVYEGHLLPEIFRGQVIHCDAGPNIVRAYPAQPDGAGYKAYMQPLLVGTRDKWFRPTDVCVAPDGSLIISDWYDPGVGGHRMQDAERGRLFRITPEGHVGYSVPKLDLSTVSGAIAALRSPNLCSRYLGWQKLQAESRNAEGPTQGVVEQLKSEVEKSDNPRHRARALWALGKIKGQGAATVDWAVSDKDSDIRILGIRLARQLQLELVPILEKLVEDDSAAVRRECAIALRFLKTGDKGRLWTKLAIQHDGEDRWYVEALGIGAGADWDLCMNSLEAYFKGTPPKNRIDQKLMLDLVWRSRSARTSALLARIIAGDGMSSEDVPRMMRAFDFQSGPEKDEALFNLAFGYTGRGDQTRAQFVNAEAIKRLGNFDITRRDGGLAALQKMLNNIKGTPQFVRLVDRFAVANRYPTLLQLVWEHPEEQLGIDAVRVLLSKNQFDLLKVGLENAKLETTLATARALELAGDGRAVRILLPILKNDKAASELRRAAARAAASSKNGAQRLIAMAKADELDSGLVPAVASKLHSSADAGVRQEAAKLFPLPPSKNKKPLPPIAELAKRKGDVARGRIVFEKTGTCAKCHKVNGQGKDVGPDLSGIGAKLSRVAFYESILFPSAGISHNYENYSIALADGNVVSGVMTSSTDASVTIINAEAISRTIPRDDIDEITKQKISIMPADIQKLLTEQDLVDVVEYMTTLKKPAPPEPKTAETAPKRRPVNLGKRLQTRFNASYRRAPLHEALGDIAKRCNVELKIDRDALKYEGYTRNMPQTIQFDQSSGIEALLGIVRKYDKMVVVLEEKKEQVLVTTAPFAKKKGLIPIRLK